MRNTLWNRYSYAVLIDLYAKRNIASLSTKTLVDSFIDYLEASHADLVKKYDRNKLEEDIREKIGEISFFFGDRPDKGKPTAELVDTIRVYKFSKDLYKVILDKALALTKEKPKAIEVSKESNVSPIVEAPKPAVIPKTVAVAKHIGSEDDLTKLLDMCGLRYNDLRYQKGCLWLEDSPVKFFLVIQLFKLGIKSTYHKNGYKDITTGKGWSIRKKNIVMTKAEKQGIVYALMAFNANKNKISLSSLDLQGKLNQEKAERLVEFLTQYKLCFMTCWDKHEIRIVWDDVNKSLEERFRAQGMHCDFVYDRFQEDGYRVYWPIDTLPLEKSMPEVVPPVAAVVDVKQQDDSKAKVKVAKKVDPRVKKAPKVKQMVPARPEKAIVPGKPITFKESEVILDEIVHRGIAYMDRRHVDGKLWILKSDKASDFLKEKLSSPVYLHQGFIGFANGDEQVAAYWIDVVEKASSPYPKIHEAFLDKNVHGYDHISGAQDRKQRFAKVKFFTNIGAVKEACVIDPKKEHTVPNRAKPQKEPVEAVTVKQEERLGPAVVEAKTKVKRPIEEDGPLYQKIYAFLKASDEEFPYGLTAGYIAEAVHCSKEDVKEVLDKVVWAQRKSIHYRFIYGDPNEEFVLDFKNLRSLSMTKPAYIEFSIYETVHVETWQQVLLVVAKMLFTLYKRDFIRDTVFDRTGLFVDTSHKDSLQAPANVGGNFWIELKRSPREVAQALLILMAKCGVTNKFMKIVYKRSDI